MRVERKVRDEKELSCSKKKLRNHLKSNPEDDEETMTRAQERVDDTTTQSTKVPRGGK